ncbi:MAG: acid phosphatase [Caulobacteraceae bacterium]
MSIRRLLLVATLLGAGAAHAQSPVLGSADHESAAGMTQPADPSAKRLPGYLDKTALPDTTAILPPPPKSGSEEEALDRAVYMETRKLQGTPRWALATSDAVETPQAILTDFGCALGIALDAANAPKLVHMLTRAHRDAGHITTVPKDFYKRPRPFIGNDEPICVPRDKWLIESASYPSGHTTASWAFGLILAELAPDRAAPILARARAYGESRVVCGVHNLSDVEEGRDNGASLVAALHGDAEFRNDLDAARAELAALRTRNARPLAGAQCQASDDAAAHTPWLPR